MYLCKMATLPEMTIETGEVYYFTRAIKYPVRRRYTPVTLTFFNTTDYTLRNAFEKWSEVLLNPSQNVGFWELGDKQRSVDGTATVKITHYGQDYSPTNLTHNSLREYTFFHAYPSSIGPLTFSYDNDTEIQTFDVTLEYSYFVGDAITSATVTTSTGFPEEGDAGDTQGGITED